MSARLLTTRQRLLYAAHTAISLALLALGRHLWGTSNVH